MIPRLASPASPGVQRSRAALAATLVASLLTACQDGTSTPPADPSSAFALASGPAGPGAGATNAAQPQYSGLLIEESNARGQAATFQLLSVTYGRLVELWGKNAAGDDVRVARDFVIGPEFTGDGLTVRLETQPVLGVDRLMIDANIEDAAFGRETFLRLAKVAADAAQPVDDLSPTSTSAPTSVPRNAALVLRFNDLVDPASKSAFAASLQVGDPAVHPFEFRFADHELIGGVDLKTGAFRSTRLIVDVTIDSLEAMQRAQGAAANPVGLPAATTEPGVPDAELRLPTLALGGVAQPLLSSGGVPLGISPGSVDYASASRDLVRRFAISPSDGAYRGFLMDDVAPRLVAEAEVQLTAAPVQQSAPDLFLLPSIQFPTAGAAGPAQVGDIVSQPGVVAEIVANSGPATSGLLSNVEVRLLEFPAGWTGPEQWETDGAGVAFYQAPYDLTMDDTRVAFLVQPLPAALGGAAAPTRGVAPGAAFQLRFNEALAPAEDQLESVIIGRSPIDAFGDFDPREAVVALGETFGGSSISGGYFVRPDVPLTHSIGSSEVYYLTPRVGANAVRDLAGNALEESPGPIAMSIDPTAADERTGGVLLGFQSVNELGNAGADFAGQLVRDFSEDIIRARPVIRFQGNVDNSQPILAQQTRFPIGVVTPFSPFGSRLQSVWRYVDMGFGLTDPTTINIDVEGLYWGPGGGSIVPDSFSEFEISLAHSRFAPDEFIDPDSLFPQFRNSGLRPVYDTNVLPDTELETVHPRQLGYVFSPADVVTSPTGQELVPFPQNRVANEPKRTYTWRDTRLRGRGGPSSAGVEPWALFTAIGLPIPSVSYFRAGEVQTIGLPLLMDISTFPDPGAVGQNSWDLNLAANSSSRPYFRAFSTGGTNTSGQSVFIDPDSETSANGGFSPGSNPPGAQTFGRDNSVLLGAADFVVRVSLVHSVWIDTGGLSLAREFRAPIATVGASSAPGTAVAVDVRGAFEIEYQDGGTPSSDNDSDENGVADMLENAFFLDLYGDFYNEDDVPALTHPVSAENPGITFAGITPDLEGSDWRRDVTTIRGARYLQLRLTLESDIETGGTVAVGAVGVSWSE